MAQVRTGGAVIAQAPGISVEVERDVIDRFLAIRGFLWFSFGRFGGFLLLLKNGVRLEFLLHILIQLQPRQLQNMNGLLHPLRQHQTLRLRLNETMFHPHHVRTISS